MCSRLHISRCTHQPRIGNPLGIHAHVNMVLVRLELLSRVPDLTSEHIWAHLQELYDLDRLNDGEGPDWSSYAEGEEGSRALRESGDEDEDNEEGTSYSLDFTLPEEWLDNIGSSAAAEETGTQDTSSDDRERIVVVCW